MEGIELRDFAFEDVAQAPVHERTLGLPVKKAVDQADKSAIRRFWSAHVRLTIEEAACRDHLGKKGRQAPSSNGFRADCDTTIKSH